MFALIAAAGFAPQLVMAQLKIGPYVQNTSTDRATVVWYTANPTNGILRYGLSPGVWQNFVPTLADTAHFVEIRELLPATKYYYEIGSGSSVYATGPEYFFETHPDINCTAPFAFAAFGDFGNGDPSQMEVAARLSQEQARFDFALLLGDIVYSRGERERYFDRYFQVYQNLIRHQTWWPTLGNHDIRAENGAAYFEFFVTPANNPYQYEHYYSFDYGSAHIVSLDGQLMVDPPQIDEQLAWLRADLQSARNRGQRWLIVMWHEAPYSGGTHSGDGFAKRFFVPIMNEFGVDLVLCGHSHVAERTYLLVDSLIVDNHPNKYLKNAFTPGTIYVVSGCGGEDGPLENPAHPLMAFQRGEVHGFELISIDRDTLRGQFITAAGDIIDDFRIIKSGLGPLRPSISLTSPNGGELWESGSTQNITWTNECFSDSVKIEYSSDGGAKWTLLKSRAPNRGTYAWTLNIEPTTRGRIRVSEVANGYRSDKSDRDFTVERQKISLPAIPAHGKIPGGDQANADYVLYTFAGQAGDMVLSYQAYDIDTKDEADVILNGTKVLDVPRTANEQWSETRHVLVPDSLVNDTDVNILIFDNTNNPPQSFWWGVRQVSVERCLPLPSIAAYGKIRGGDQARADFVSYTFAGQAGDVVLFYQAYDIDTKDEADVILNGIKVADVPRTTNEQWSETRQIILPDLLVNDTGTNVLIFDNTDNPPQTFWWGVRQVSVERCSQLPSLAAYGKIPGGDQAHADRMLYTFAGQAGEVILSYQAYDIDNKDEADAVLNGIKVFDVPRTANEQWSETRHVLLPDSLVNDAGINALIFDNTSNPPQSFWWGVRQVSVEYCFQLPSLAAYGKIPGSDLKHADKVGYCFPGQAGNLRLTYDVYDIDNVNEVDVVLNGTKIRDEAKTVNNSWSGARTLLLPDTLVNNTGINVLVFDHAQNPPNAWIWGVRNVSVAPTATIAAAINPSQVAGIAGDKSGGIQYLFDGMISYTDRSEENDGTLARSAGNPGEGATGIDASGHLMIEFSSPQRLDYMLLYPEENPQRFFSYRIEASINGKDWQTLADKTASPVHGVQLDQFAGASARFLRISGAGYVCDLEKLPQASPPIVAFIPFEGNPGNELNEESYWQAYEEMIRQTGPTSLAIAELALFRQQPMAMASDEKKTLPASFHLAQNFPNPFNPTTTIRYELPVTAKVRLAIYNLRGELVRTLVEAEMPAGYHKATFDASGLASGIYFYRLNAGAFTATRKMALTK
jgi:3',5'-cyclic AMP phosphodiesterase CpdA